MTNVTPIIITLVILTGIMLGMGSFYTEMGTNYQVANITGEGNFTQFNETYTEMNEKMKDLQNRTVGFSTKDLTVFRLFGDAVMAFIDIGVTIFTMPGIIIQYVSLSVGFLPHIPEFVLFTINTIITIVFTMAVVSMLLKRSST